jgi:hypothetical protein
VGQEGRSQLSTLRVVLARQDVHQERYDVADPGGPGR